MSKARGITFERYGRSYHISIKTAQDLENVLGLNEAHWVATGAPTGMFNCDRTFLKLLDIDNNGRILCHEVKDAIRFAMAALGDRTPITTRSSILKLDTVDADSPQGRAILNAAAETLTALGQQDAAQLTLEQMRRLKAQAEAQPVSEAGVVLPTAAENSEFREFISDIIAAVGGAAHPSGDQGVDSAQLDSFIRQADAFVDWYERRQLPAGKKKTQIMPLGSDTLRAYQLFSSLKGKIDQYFAQCVALTLDERFAQRMGWTDAELQNLDFDNPAVIEQVLQKAPIAKARTDQLLDFNDRINPHYAGALESFRREFFQPILGKNEAKLSVENWQKIKSFFSAHDDWVQSKPGAAVEPLGYKKLQKYLDRRFADAVRALIAESERTASMLEKVRLLEKVVLLQLYLIDFANNFVSFPHLYDPAGRAMFETGSLVMDGRRFNLAVRVQNQAEHKAIAASSNMYVLYLEVVPEGGRANFYLAVPVTSGGKGNLCLGKRGVFYPCAPGFGDECDAKVVDIIENPISFREALLSPFQRLARALVGKIESITTDTGKKLDTQVSSAVDRVAAQPQAGQPAPTPPAATAASRAGLLMGAGVAAAALGSALAYITKTLASIHPLKVVLALLTAALAVMLPISIIALFKLRRRDLSAILEGSGWAINAPMRLTHKQSVSFTEKPPYPKGSGAVQRFRWPVVVVILLLVAAFAAGLYLLRRPDTSPASAPVPVTEKQTAQ